MLTEHPLAVVQVTTGPEGPHLQYKAALDSLVSIIGEKEVSFGAWWDAAVLRDPKRREFSRKNLVFFFRNKMGGGHVSEGYDQLENTASIAFADLARSDAGGWLVSSGNGMLRPEYGVQFATVRQIGWELEQTLKRHCGDLVTHMKVLAAPLPRMISVNDRGLA